MIGLKRARGAGDAWMAILLIQFCLLASCSDGRRDLAMHSGLYTTPLPDPGVEQTRSLGPLPAARTVVPEAPVVRIGSSDGDSDYLFADISAIALDTARGWIFAVDRQRRDVRAFRLADGILQTRFGRHGRGPGEFEDPQQILLLSSDRVAVWDAALQRLSLFSPEGAYLESRAAPGGDAGARVLGLARTLGTPKAMGSGFAMSVRSDPLEVPPEAQRGHLLRLDSLLQVEDTLLTYLVPGIEAESRVSGSARNTSYTAPPLFSPEPVWDLSPKGRLAFAPGGTYEVFILDSGGNGLAKIVRSMPPERVTRSDRIRRLEAAMADPRQGFPRALGAAAVEPILRSRFAYFRPMIMDILVDQQDQIWVQRFGTEFHPEGKGCIWDLYSPTGLHSGAIAFPPGFQPKAFSGGRAYGVQVDSLGVQTIVGYEVPRQLTSFARGAP